MYQTDDSNQNNDKCTLDVPFHLWHNTNYVFFRTLRTDLHTIHHIPEWQLLEYG
jgi:hypothetical protein